MRFLTNLLTFLLASTSLAAPGRKSFAGTKVIRVTLGSDVAAAEKLDALIKKLELPTWTDVVKPDVFVDVEVPKGKLSSFQQGIKSYHTLVMHEDLEKSIVAEAATGFDSDFTTQRVAAAAVDTSWFTSYHPYADHMSWISELVAQYPNNARAITAGQTAQGRTITGIHVYGASGPSKKPAAVIHGTVHAREWITTMTAEYTAYALLSNYANSTQVKTLVDSYDYYVFPIVNPDGFVYTQTTNRMWRKNRQPATAGCTGVDMNRNWPNRWVGSGSSTDGCSETYRGPSAGSTPEVRGLSAFQNALSASAAGAKFYMDFHSYGQLWMYPYGYNCSVLPPDNAEFSSLTNGAISAIRTVYGTPYTGGPICNTIYQVNGDSVDYAYEVSKIKYAFTAELRDKGNAGFVLPPAQIWPTVREAWEGTKFVLLNMR